MHLAPSRHSFYTGPSCFLVALRVGSADSDFRIDKHELDRSLVALIGEQRRLTPYWLNVVWDFLNPDGDDVITFGEVRCSPACTLALATSE
jgi:hypothetical protein